MEFSPRPTYVGQYVLQQYLGRGGMAEVYLSIHPVLERRVAIKLMLPHIAANTEGIGRFVLEAQMVAQLRHPNIVAIYDYGDTDGQRYIVMEYIGGPTLKSVLSQRHTLPIEQALHITAQIAQALEHAHRQNLIHRDVKPGNIMFLDETLEQAILTDFGLVRVLGDGHTTADGLIVGTPAYMSPEVVKGEPATFASDFYALGITLFQMLTGEPVYTADSALPLMMKHVQDPLPNFRALGIPPSVATLLNALLEKDPALRVATGTDIVRMINRFIHPNPSENFWVDAKGQDIWVDLEDDSPPHAHKLVGSLPVTFDQRSVFVGRAQQLESLRSLILAGERVILVQGKSGIGKSALASKVLSDLVQTTGDLRGIVALSAVQQDGQALQITLDNVLRDFETLLATTQFSINPQQTPQQRIDALLAATRHGQYVLLLDNLETLQNDDHTLRDAALTSLIETVLINGGLTVVLTSQMPLRLTKTGGTARIATLFLDHGLPADDALNLLGQIWPGGGVPADADLHALITATDGHPRALEAAVDWLVANPIFTTQDLLNEINQQQGDVVSNLIGKSISALQPDLRRTLQALALFPMPASIPALEHVLAPFVGGSTRDHLNRLVLRRFARLDRTTRMLDLHTIDRAYSLAHLPTTPADEVAFGRYALLRRAASYFESIRKPEADWKTYDDLLPQLNELEFRMALGEHDTAAKILYDIDFGYLLAWGYARQVAALHERLVGHIEDPEVAQASMGTLAIAHYFIGDLGKAIDTFQQAYTLCLTLGNTRSAGNHLGNMGNAYRTIGQFDRAIDCYQKALEISIAGEHTNLESAANGNLGVVYDLLGDTDQAVAHLQRALAISRTEGLAEIEASAMGNLGYVLAKTDAPEASIQHIQHSIALAQRIKNRYYEADSLLILGEAHLLHGDLAAARAALQSASQIDFDEINHQVTSLAGMVAMQLGDMADAQVFLGRAIVAANDVLSKTAAIFRAHFRWRWPKLGWRCWPPKATPRPRPPWVAGC